MQPLHVEGSNGLFVMAPDSVVSAIKPERPGENVLRVWREGSIICVEIVTCNGRSFACYDEESGSGSCFAAHHEDVISIYTPSAYRNWVSEESKEQFLKRSQSIEIVHSKCRFLVPPDRLAIPTVIYW